MSTPTRILVVEDEARIAEVVQSYLEREGHMVVRAATGEDALADFARRRPDLVVLDLGLPGMAGEDVCRRIRAASDVPIIMLTAKDGEEDLVKGLQLGADDYLTKPFSPRELTARVKAVLRRASPAAGEEGAVLAREGLTIDVSRRSVEVEGVGPVELTAKEFDLLHALAANPGIVLTRERLMEKVWGYEYIGDSRAVDVYIRHLREKLSDDADNPRFIETVRGVGYRFKSG